MPAGVLFPMMFMGIMGLASFFMRPKSPKAPRAAPAPQAPQAAPMPDAPETPEAEPTISPEEKLKMQKQAQNRQRRAGQSATDLPLAGETEDSAVKFKSLLGE